MKVVELCFEGVYMIEPECFSDGRGYYMESYSSRTLAQHDIGIIFIQDNHVLSLKKNTIRGIHFQMHSKAQTKLVRCTKGSILDVVVDLRKGSNTYKKWISVVLDAKGKKQILIPKGYGHACMSLEDHTELQYKVDEFYEPDYERVIAWNDPELGIQWGTNDVILSDKDKNAPFLQQSDCNFIYGEEI